MLILDATTKKIQVKTDALVTVESPVVVSWDDITTTAFTPGASQTITTNTTAVDAVAAPAAATQRTIKYMSLTNNDTGAHVVTFIYNDNGTLRNILIVTLQIGDTITYANGQWTKTAKAAANLPPTVQTFTSGSGTYTKPTGVLYIRVRAVGGGGGGAGSNLANNGGTGGNTTFGPITASGAVNVTGGAASLGAGPIGLAIPGAPGQRGSTYGGTSIFGQGGLGAPSPFSGGGSGGFNGSGGVAAQANSGAGGGGGGTTGAAGNQQCGDGGGAGGYVEAIITNPAATYSYGVGAGGSGGAAGTPGVAGVAGGSGYIIVEEFYQ